MLSHSVPDPKDSSGGRITLAALFLMALVCFGCTPKVVRVPVSKEDILRANTAVKEGDLAFNRKDYYAALVKYLEGSRLNPNDEYIQNRLGIAYSQLKYYVEATNAFRRSVGLNPNYAYSVNNLGSVYFAREHLKEAEKHFKKAISIKGDEASFHVNLGSLYFERKKFDKAMVEWRKGLALDPDVLTKDGNVNVSMAGATSSVIERDYFTARLFASTGDVVKALDSLRQALDHGFSDIGVILKEPDFDPIRKDERFIEFMKVALQSVKAR